MDDHLHLITELFKVHTNLVASTTNHVITTQVHASTQGSHELAKQEPQVFIVDVEVISMAMIKILGLAQEFNVVMAMNSPLILGPALVSYLRTML